VAVKPLAFLLVFLLFVPLIGKAVDAEHASAGGTVAVRELYQGKPIEWWARRTVQARKDANARGRTIRRLRAELRHGMGLSTGHWLDGAFMCIKRYEEDPRRGWQTNTGNGYYGGLQMDRSFQRTYGAWALRAFGLADRWPASVQIAVAIRAWTSRGFGPWPNTRLRCGL
jgi:hypothetical protein